MVAILREVLSAGTTEDGEHAVLNFAIESSPGKVVQAGFLADAQMASMLLMAVLTAVGAQRVALTKASSDTEHALNMFPPIAPRITGITVGQGERHDGTTEVALVAKLQTEVELVLGLDRTLASGLRDELTKVLAKPPIRLFPRH